MMKWLASLLLIALGFGFTAIIPQYLLYIYGVVMGVLAVFIDWNIGGD